jgi:hypothetical protein
VKNRKKNELEKNEQSQRSEGNYQAQKHIYYERSRVGERIYEEIMEKTSQI